MIKNWVLKLLGEKKGDMKQLKILGDEKDEKILDNRSQSTSRIANIPYVQYFLDFSVMID